MGLLHMIQMFGYKDSSVYPDLEMLQCLGPLLRRPTHQGQIQMEPNGLFIPLIWHLGPLPFCVSGLASVLYPLGGSAQWKWVKAVLCLLVLACFRATPKAEFGAEFTA